MYIAFGNKSVTLQALDKKIFLPGRKEGKAGCAGCENRKGNGDAAWTTPIEQVV